MSKRCISFLYLFILVLFYLVISYYRLEQYSGLYVSDGGNFVSEAKQVIGRVTYWYNDSPVLEGRHPILSLALLGVLVIFFNPFQSLAIYAIIGAVSSIIGLYIFISKYFDNLTAFITTFLFSISLPFNLQMTWGNIFAYFGYCFILIILSRLEITLNLRHIFILSLFTFFLVGFDPIPLIFYIITFIFYIFLNLLVRFISKNYYLFKKTLKFASIYIILSIFLSLPFLPQYFNLFSLYVRGELKYSTTSNYYINILEIIGSFNNLMFPPIFWIIIISMGSLALFLEFKKYRKFASLIYIYVSLLFAYLILQFFILINRPARMIYYLNVISTIPLAILLNYHTRISSKFVKSLVITIILALLFFTWLPIETRVSDSYRFYNRGKYGLDDSRIRVLETLKELVPKNVTIITNVRGHFDFWIQGYSERRAIGIEEPFVYLSEDLTFSDERWRAHIASIATSGNIALENGFIQLLDTFPIAYANPYFGIFVGAYERKIFLNDSMIIIEYYDTRIHEHKALSLNCASKTFIKNLNTLIYVYNLTDFIVYKSYTLIDDRVLINFKITPLKKEIYINRITIPFLLIDKNNNHIEFSNNLNHFTIRGKNSFGYNWTTFIDINECTNYYNCSLLSLLNYYGVNVTLMPRNALSNLSFSILLRFSEDGFILDSYKFSLQFINATYWINYYKVKYAVIDGNETIDLKFLELTNKWVLICEKIDRFYILYLKNNN
jgi:hypothetical protein